jgi:type IV secretion system protein TrbC
MFNNAAISHFLRQYGMLVLMLCVVIILMAMPHVAHATESQGLPFEGPLEKLKKSIQGPVAFAISLIGIIGAGAALIFGGEMSGFMRTMVFLVLVISIITNASNLVEMIGGSAATIADSASLHLRSVALSMRGMG